MKTLRAAKTLLAREGLLTLRDLAKAIIGGPFKGSWWGHAKGKLVYAISSALEDEPGVVTCTLKDGVVTFVDPAVVPALLSLVSDLKWRSSRMKGLSPSARRLYARVQKEEVEIVVQYKKDGAEIAGRLLVRATSRHTPTGRHATFLSAWKKPARPIPFRVAAAELERLGASSLHLVRDLVEFPP